MNFAQRLKLSIQLHPERFASLISALSSASPIVQVVDEYDINEEITYGDYINLSDDYGKRFVFPQNPSTLSASMNGKAISFFGEILQISDVKPHPMKIIKTCTRCKAVYSKIVKVPINHKSIDEFKLETCVSELCQFSKSSSWEFYEEYVDCCEVTVMHYNRRINGFLKSIPSQGFEEVKNKLYAAVEMGVPIIVHGFLFIEETQSGYEYFAEIADIEFTMDKRLPIRLIPFNIPYAPNNEKEMVMGIFFANISFMKKYLGFDEWTLQVGYPDLTIYSHNGIRHIEFEYDVANFYKHGHHKQQDKAKCDLIIAWKNTSSRHDFNVLLLPELIGKMIPDRLYTKLPLRYDPEKMMTCMCTIIKSLFSHRSDGIILPVLLSLVSFRKINGILDKNGVTFVINDADDRDKRAYDSLCNMFDHKRGEGYIDIAFGRKNAGSSHYIIKCTIERRSEEHHHSFDGLFELKEYMDILRAISPSLAPLYMDTHIIDELYSHYRDLNIVDIISFASCTYANFVQKDRPDREIVMYMSKVLDPYIFSYSA